MTQLHGLQCLRGHAFPVDITRSEKAFIAHGWMTLELLYRIFLNSLAAARKTVVMLLQSLAPGNLLTLWASCQLLGMDRSRKLLQNMTQPIAAEPNS